MPAMSVWLWLSPSLAATLEVGPDAYYPTLLDALYNAADGDVILVAPGVYEGPFYLGDRSVEIVSTGGSAVTTLVQSPYIHYDAVVVVYEPAPVTLRGFTIDGEGFVGGMGVYNADVFAEDIHFRGGAHGTWLNLDVWESSLTLVNSTFSATLTTLGRHGEIDKSEVLFDNVAFRKGYAFYSGGALSVWSSDATFRRCIFSDNVAEQAGGALRIAVGVSQEILIEDSLFLRNVSYDYGGAILQDGGNLTLTRTTLRDNEARWGSGALDHTDGVLFRFEDGVVEGNHTDSYGAGLALYNVQQTVVRGSQLMDNTAGDRGAGLMVMGQSLQAEIAGNRFCGNRSGSGGGIWLESYDALSANIHNNVFVANRALGEGAALGLYRSVAALSQNTIVDSITDEGNGAVWVGYGGSAALVNNTIVGSVGAPLYRETYGGQIQMAYNLLHGNDRAPVNIMRDETTVEAAPGFREHIAGDCGSDLRPSPESALIDAGDPGLQDDDGSRADIGAYGGPGASTLVDVDGDGVIAGDCDPFDALASLPSEELVADGLDQDCDGLDLCYVDADGDGVGSAQTGPAPVGCDTTGFSAVTGDCDDADLSLAADCDDAPGKTPGPRAEALPPSWFCSSAGAAPSWLWLIGGLAAGLRRASRRRVMEPRP